MGKLKKSLILTILGCFLFLPLWNGFGAVVYESGFSAYEGINFDHITLGYNWKDAFLHSTINYEAQTVTYFKGGNPHKIAVLSPDAGLMHVYLDDKGLWNEFIDWINGQPSVVFSLFDIDGDGEIEDDELTQPKVQAAFNEMRNMVASGELSEDNPIYKFLDEIAGEDDYISEDEFTEDDKEYLAQELDTFEVKCKYAYLDENGDGTISDDEAENLSAIADFLATEKGYESDEIVKIFADNSKVNMEYIVRDDSGQIIMRFRYLPDEDKGEQKYDKDKPLWSPEKGYINGYRAEITLFDNGRMSKRVSWSQTFVDEDGSDEYSWKLITADFFDDNGDGKNDRATGNAGLIGADVLGREIPGANIPDIVYVKFNNLEQIEEIYVGNKVKVEDTEEITQGTKVASCKYDLRGNRTEIIAYSGNGRYPTEIGRIEMSYDPDGNLTSRKIYKGAGESAKLIIEEAYTIHLAEHYVRTKQVVSRYDTYVEERHGEEVVIKEEDIDGDGLAETVKYTYKTKYQVEVKRQTIDTTYFLFGRPLFLESDRVILEEKEIEGTKERINNPPTQEIINDPEPPRADPAATGTILLKDGKWYMEVVVWTNPQGTTYEVITVELDLETALEIPLEEMEEILREFAKSGELLTLYGYSDKGILYEGAVLQVVNLGKGPFGNHPDPKDYV
jgi:hypothetical protein